MRSRDLEEVMGAAGRSAASAAADACAAASAATGVSAAAAAVGGTRRLRLAASSFLPRNGDFFCRGGSPAASCSSEIPRSSHRLPLAAAAVASCCSDRGAGAAAAVASLHPPAGANTAGSVGCPASFAVASSASPSAASAAASPTPPPRCAVATTPPTCPADPSAAATACASAVATPAAAAAPPAAAAAPPAAAGAARPAFAAAGSAALPPSSSPVLLPAACVSSSPVAAVPPAAAAAPAAAAQEADGCPYGYGRRKGESQGGGAGPGAAAEELQRLPEVAALSDLRSKSSIPSKNGGTWSYPSERQFYQVTRSKGHRVEPQDMHAVVAIHNAVNERAWQEILAYENLHRGACAAPRLERFLGKPAELSWKAKMTHLLLGWDLPFDRHEWTVDRCGEKVKYLIDFYDGQATSTRKKGAASIYIDARPDIWGRTGLVDRLKLFIQKKKLLSPPQQ